MKLLRFFLPLLATLTLCSCSDDPAAPQAAEGPILPLAVGNKWTGQQKKFNADGSLVRSDAHTTEVTGDSTLAGETWYMVNDAGLMTNRSDGLYEWESSFGPGSAVIALKHPATVGQTFQIATPIGVGNMTLVGIGEPLTVNGTTYRCSHYRMTIGSSGNEIHMYLEPGKGWVKRETKMKRSDGSHYTFEVWEVSEIILR